MKPDRGTIWKLLDARRSGLPLRLAARVAGVHVATVCRWQARDPELRQRLAEAAREGRVRRSAPGLSGPVRWRRDCPLCKARVVVRTGLGKVRFWRCGRWPLCPWASWRPRAPRNCKRCGAPCFWSKSRKTIGCSGCGVRTYRR